MAYTIDPKLFKLPTLSQEEKDVFVARARSWLPDMMKVVNQTSEDGWAPCGMYDPTVTNGVTLCKKVTEGTCLKAAPKPVSSALTLLVLATTPS